MPEYLVDLAALRSACARESRAHGVQPSRGALGDQLDEDPAPEAPTEHPAPRTTP